MSARELIVDAHARRKSWATAQAHATLAGYVANLIETDGGGVALIVSLGPYTRSLESLKQAEDWLALVTGRARQIQPGQVTG